MATVISIHSFRGGTGKSNVTANVAALLALEGKRVGIIDTDIQSPGIHVLLGIKGNEVNHSLNDYLWGNATMEAVTVDVTPKQNPPVQGRVYLAPSSINPGEIARILRDHYDDDMLRDGMQEMIDKFALDVLMIDTHPGLNQETLLSIAISSSLVVVMRPDEQDYEGTKVTIEVARRLGVPRMMLVVNKVPETFDAEQVRSNATESYNIEVPAVIPHADEMMALGSKGLFTLRYPNHPITAQLTRLAHALVIDEKSTRPHQHEG